MKIRMLKTTSGSYDGVSTKEYTVGNDYAVGRDLISEELAKVFVSSNVAVEIAEAADAIEGEPVAGDNLKSPDPESLTQETPEQQVPRETLSQRDALTGPGPHTGGSTSSDQEAYTGAGNPTGEQSSSDPAHQEYGSADSTSANPDYVASGDPTYQTGTGTSDTTPNGKKK